MAELIVKSKCKDWAKPMRCPDRVLEALDEKVKALIEEAKARAECNNRKTLKECDW